MIGFKQHTSEFKKDELEQELEEFDDFLKEQYADTLKSIKGETVVKNGLPIRITDLEFTSGNRLKKFLTKDERGSYDAMIGIFKKRGQSEKSFLAEYKELSNQFIDSIEIINYGK